MPYLFFSSETLATFYTETRPENRCEIPQVGRKSSNYWMVLSHDPPLLMDSSIPSFRTTLLGSMWDGSCKTLTARKFCGFREVQAALAKVTLTITEKGYFGNGLPWGFCADACWHLCLLYNTLSDDFWKHSVQFILILGIFSFSPVFFLWRCVYRWRNYTKLLAAAIPFSNHFAKLKYNFLATKPLMLVSCPYTPSIGPVQNKLAWSGLWRPSWKYATHHDTLGRH